MPSLRLITQPSYRFIQSLERLDPFNSPSLQILVRKAQFSPFPNTIKSTYKCNHSSINTFASSFPHALFPPHHQLSFKMASNVSPPSSMAKTSEPNRNKKYDPKKPHITEEPITKANWYKHVNWLNVTLIVGVPIYGLIMAYWTPLQWKTAVWAVLYYFMTGLGITAGRFQSILFPS